MDMFIAVDTYFKRLQFLLHKCLNCVFAPFCSQKATFRFGKPNKDENDSVICHLYFWG
jgi:hypothetical protein